MTPAGTWPFPPGRALHGWFSSLAPRQPERLWFAHLLLHRVEALADVTHTHRLDPFPLALLHRCAAPDGEPQVPSLRDTGIDRQLLSRWLNALAALGLVVARGPTWELTEAGRAALPTGTYTKLERERRTFYFADSGDVNRPAAFLHLARPALPYPSPGSNWHFDPSWLRDYLRRPAEWKRTHHFPADVTAIVTSVPPRDAATLPWREVILDRPECLAVAIIQTATGVQGFQTQPEDWKLRTDEPAFTLAADWELVLPDLGHEPSMELWRSAWQGWCRQRNLPAAETDGCALERRAYQLEVRASRRLLERLKATRNDVLHGETWLLAGTGRTRTAACLKIVEGAD